MLITCCLLAADGVLQISGERKLTSGKMEDKENGKTPAQLKDDIDIDIDISGVFSTSTK